MQNINGMKGAYMPTTPSSWWVSTLSSI